MFAIVTIGAAFAGTIRGALACRLLAGVAGDAAASQGSYVILDLWDVDERTAPFMIYCMTPVFAPVIAMITGASVLWREDYQWTQYVPLFAFTASAVAVVCMSETSRESIARKSQQEPRDEDDFVLALIGPLPMFARPVMFFLSLYVSCVIAVVYGSFLSFTRAFSQAYKFDLASDGLTYASMLVGLLLGVLVEVLCYAYAYLPRQETWQAQRAAEVERTRRQSKRARTASAKSGVSNFSRPTIRQPEVAWIRDSQAGVAKSSGRNCTLAMAIANYVDNLPANDKTKILPEHIANLLDDNPAFGDLRAAIEKLQVILNKVELAKALADALAAQGDGAGEDSGLARSTSLHRHAAAAALDTPAAKPPTIASPRTGHQWKKEARIHRPPAAWRLWLALPMTVLLPASLFTFGWTATAERAWVAPCVGMCLFAFSALIIITSAALYMVDFHGEQEAPNALASGHVMTYLLIFAFAMFALPLYEGLAAAWATSLPAFIVLALGTTIWIAALSARSR